MLKNGYWRLESDFLLRYYKKTKKVYVNFTILIFYLHFLLLVGIK